MTENRCENLDDYLDGVLDPAAARQFQMRHLPECERCRGEASFHQALAATAVAAERREAVPKRLTEQLQRAVRRVRRRRRAYWAAGVAAAAWMGLLAWPDSERPQRAGVGDTARVQRPPPRPESPSSGPSQRAPRTVTISSGNVRVRAAAPGFLAVPAEASNDRVTLVMVYPTVRTPAKP